MPCPKCAVQLGERHLDSCPDSLMNVQHRRIIELEAQVCALKEAVSMPVIFVDFQTRDPEGHFYAARLSRFDQPPPVGFRFIGSDYEGFSVVCKVLAVDHSRDRVYLRPVNATDVPGTHP